MTHKCDGCRYKSVYADSTFKQGICLWASDLQSAISFYKMSKCDHKELCTDMVEVVRCKDCKYYEIHKPSITLNCERDGRLIPMMPYDYCSRGEPKTDGNGEGE